jgi:hypothetical protein
MTIDEIFSELAQHMIEGLMTHSQLADYYGFLGLYGYQKCHLYHFYDENINYKKICDYFLKHQNKLVIEKPFNNPSVIPENWYQYRRQDVSQDTRRNAAQMGLELWVNWEKKTKVFYEKIYKELYDINEIAAVEEVAMYLTDVDYELAEAEKEMIKRKADNYNMDNIIQEQDEVEKRYKKKMEGLEIL